MMFVMFLLGIGNTCITDWDVYMCVCVCVANVIWDRLLCVIWFVDEVPDLRRLKLFVADQMSDYHGLGIVLGLSANQLRHIEGQHPEVVRRCIEVLSTWVEQETKKPVTWRTLITALRELKQNKLAGKLNRELSSN